MTGSSNHKHDPERDADRTAHDRLLDDMQRSAPAPRPGFAADLETRLVAQLETQTKTRGRPNPMQTTYRLSVGQDAETNTRRFTIPVTMAAAVLALIVAGALIIAYGMQPPPEDNSAAAPIVQQDESPTPPPTATDVIVPSQRPLSGTFLTATAVIAEATWAVRPSPTMPGPTAIISGDESDGDVNLLSSPEANANVVATVSRGTEVVVQSGLLTGDWYFVWIDNATRGWIPGFELISDDLPQPPPTAVPNVTATPVPESADVVVPTAIPVITATAAPTVTPSEPVPFGPGGTPVVAPNGYRPVVIALNDIPADVVIEDFMVALTYWPEDIVPPDTFSQIDLVIGLVLDEPVPQWHPVQMGQLTAELDPNDDDLVAVRMARSPYAVETDVTRDGLIIGRYATQAPVAGVIMFRSVGSLFITTEVGVEGRALVFVRGEQWGPIASFPVVPVTEIEIPDGIEILNPNEPTNRTEPLYLLMRPDDAQALLDNEGIGTFLIRPD